MMPRDDIGTYEVVAGGDYNPDTGMPNPISSQTVTVMGRYDAKVSQFVQRGTDGSFTAPKFVFYMDLDAPVIALETELKVEDVSSGLTFTGTVKQYNKGLLNAYVLCQ